MGPNASRKPGGELDYTNAEKVCGGPLDNQAMQGLEPGFEVSGDSAPKGPK